MEDALPPDMEARDQGPLPDLEPLPDAAVDRGPVPDGCAPMDEVCNGLDDDCDGFTDEDTDGIDCEAGGLGLCARGRLACVNGQEQCLGPVPGIEQCNGLDDDCDGIADEEASEGGACPTGLPGACGEGIRVCGPNGLTCTPAEQPSPERCNGEDDDCDGRIDEADPELGLACVFDAGQACGVGRTICVDGDLECEPGEPGAERCNGVDDDCDDAVDEGVAQGPCDTGLLGECADGVQACIDGAAVCVPANPAVPELCNGLDDDCDGRVDEDDPGAGPCDTGAPGACAAGTRSCVDGRLICRSDARPAVELCNGVDDDCDGGTDEAAPESGLACNAGADGACVAGATACAGGVLVCLPGEPGAEQCNALDDDCDGQIDEFAADGDDCLTGIPGLCAIGRSTCLNGAPLCQPLVEAREEVCNGLDDDCDGSIDEFTAEAGGACTTGLFGPCATGVVACLDGAPTCVADADPAAEVCNGEDDDCDGVADETAPDVGRACNPGGADGECRTGQTACEDGLLVCIAGPAGFERCDGVDDDCDGNVDEQVPQGGACDSGQPGICAAGTLACTGGALVCRPSATPADEACNGLDDDCDGIVDEGTRELACSTGAAGVCAAGRTVCDDGVADCVPAIAPSAESCNGLDDDCDGAEDEGGPEEGLACDAGAGGACQAGATVCVDGALGCQPGAPGAEQCNGEDDDCDGRTDEDTVQGPCATGLFGVCAIGARTCDRGVEQCVPDRAPDAEICNGLDDDCDGVTDEGTGGAACGTGLPGICAAGVVECVAGAPTCVSTAAPTAETCDGSDEDCDGAVDEGQPGGGRACDPGGAGECNTGSTACAAGSIVCVAGEPGAETCNGLDDDCDGVTDEGTDGGDCGTGQPGECTPGSQTCVDGALVCRADVSPASEACDLLDNDCDGITDEGLVDGGGCDTGQVGACAAGTRICTDGAPTCVPTVLPEPERCDGQDNDCDGTVDEGDPEGGAACDRGMGDGECAVGTTTCVAGALVCEPGEGGPEQCNGLDDDCDGSTDEGAPTGLDCATGLAGVCAAGVSNCLGGAPTCEPRQAPGLEGCNGLDDDCDGTTDEGIGGAPCDTGGAGRCSPGVLTCVGGAPACERLRGPVAETCNGVDDDCDGSTDEGEPGAGQACNPEGASGVCATGSTACLAGALVCIGGAPGAETCNGIDDDCDDTIDEGVAAGAACASGQPGVCGPGVRACVDGSAACVPDRTPGAESCNQLDDDCDGSTDEGTGGGACDTGRAGPCAAGVLTCMDGGLMCVGQVDPGIETCDGTDEDCDGRIDEGDPGAGDACDPGGGVMGECRTGTTACVAGAVECIAGDAGAEVCNGDDDDCDGNVDENLPVRVCDTGLPGVCGEGTQACDRGVEQCIGNRNPGPEACNGLDDDCDGTTDEGTGGAACDTGADGICAAGLLRCDAGVVRCEQTAAAQAEVCDGLDDDCDGIADEGDPGGGVACDPGGGAAGECATGATVCAAGAVICQPGDPGAEACNGLDDDCDDAIDEDVPAGGDCDTGLDGLCAPGDLECRGGAQVCIGRRAPVDEACNGLDDDCDGRTDEGTGGEACGTGLDGQCAVGRIACRAGAPVCEQSVFAAPEACNGLDDDCDGSNDEGNPDEGVACDPGGGVAGQCATGSTICQAGAVICQPGEPGAEACNGADDDCDDSIDEDVPEGPCDTGRPGVCAAGTTACAAGVSICVQDSVAGAETCNGLDDDCDGRVDEGDPGAGACNTGEDGVCAAGTLTCIGGALQCVRLTNPGAEQCNGLDDDCDGSSDEGDPGAGQACDPGDGVPGECRAGITACDGGAIVCNPEGQGAEACNGLDDDCDGTTDEEVPEGADCATGRPGICSPGTTMCENGAVVCEQIAAAEAEACNGLDDDCDGSTDEGDPGGGADCDTGQPGVCGPGVRTCQGGGLVCAARVAAGPEICNGEDDDCDGRVDEGDPGGGVGCDTGNDGVCAAGLTACQAGVVACVQQTAAGAETCDGLDEDCDGTADEGTGGAACRTGEDGQCDPGTEACRGGVLVCERSADPAPETCDGTDEDCDGTTDEGDPGGGAACDTGNDGLCAAGTERCQGAAIVCVQDQPPAAEICDGLDQDCDGVADNGNPGGGVACATGEDGVCGAGTTNCRAGAIACDRDVDPGPERCNGLDDDCDGTVDEGNPEGGGGCNTGELGVCSAGTEACQGGALVCVRSVAPGPETCDGTDEDCDGVIDDGDPDGGGACDTGEQGVCAAGVETCQAGALACVRTVDPAPEACDGIDNDCDGAVDNGDPGGGVGCDTGAQGICAPGTTACRGGAIACDANEVARVETCEGADEDCDGTVDEGNPGGGAACDTGSFGICAAGTELCSGGEIICARDQDPQIEACNGLDDDCDNRLDEVRPAPCPTGLLGQCGLGLTVCENAVERCQAVFQPGDECEVEANGTDEDCDGFADERPDVRCLPAEIQLVRSCLDDNDVEVGLSMTVDDLGTPHLARVNRILGDLLYTVVDVDGTFQNETVTSRMSLIGNDETAQTDIVFFGGQPAICYRDARQRHFAIAFRQAANNWRIEIVAAGNDIGRYCGLAIDGAGRLTVAYQQDGNLRVATRNAANNYAVEVVDRPATSVGHHIDYLIFGGVPVIAHHDTDSGTLRLTARFGAAWNTAFTRPGAPAGWRPALILDGNGLFIIHGQVPDDPDLGSDGPLYITQGNPVLNTLDTNILDDLSVGGWPAAYRGNNDIIVFARERLRSALFGSQDGLYVYTEPDPVGRNPLEQSGNGGQRHTYLWLDAGGDPFQLPMLAYSDRRGAFGADPGESVVCLYRPLDTDLDRLPDSVEIELGTDPADPDSDGDGVDDGQEVLVDGTDPTVP